MVQASHLVIRLQRFIQLTPMERKVIARLETPDQPLPRNHVLVSPGDALTDIFVLRRGWAVERSGERASGRSAIIRIYLPGDFVGLGEIAGGVAHSELAMQTDGAVARFPRQTMRDLYAETPRLAALMTSLTSLDHLTLRERVRGLIRLDAEERLIQFLVLLYNRYSMAMAMPVERLPLPFSQAELGDILGLTSVYVNRLLRKLREEGRLELHQRSVRLLDRAHMEAQVGYRDPHSQLDTSWFPAPVGL